jgi:hypothetical protein
VGAVASAWGGARGALKNIGRNAMPRLRSGLRLSRCDKKSEPTPTQADKLAPPGEGWVRNDTPGGQTFGQGDMAGTYYIDASTTAGPQQAPALGVAAIRQKNYVGAYFKFTDKAKANPCGNGLGSRAWLSYKYYKEATVVGAQASAPPLGQWSPDIWGNFATNGADFEDFAGLTVPGGGVSGLFRRTYRVGIVCACRSAPTSSVVKGFLTDYSYNLDVWFNDNDVAVRVTPGGSYGGAFDWCQIPPSGVTCVDTCPAATPAPSTTPGTSGTSTPSRTPAAPPSEQRRP